MSVVASQVEGVERWVGFVGSVLEEQERSIVGQRSAVRAPGSEKDFVQELSPLRLRLDEGL